MKRLLICVFLYLALKSVLSQQCINPKYPYYNTSIANCTRCPTTTPYYYSLNSSCVRTCPPEAEGWDRFNWCKPCRSPTPIWDRATLTCKGCATDFKWNPYNSSCLTSCPDYASVYNTVTQACEPSQYECPIDPNRYYYPLTTQCLTKCPPEAPAATGSYDCYSCPQERPYFLENSNFGTCLAECYNTTHYIDEYKWCRTCTYATGSYWNNKTKNCTSTCPRDIPYADNYGWCQACPPELPYFLNDTSSALCVEFCPYQKPSISNDSWCEECADGTYWNPNNKSCVVTCPPERPRNTTWKYCEICERSSPFWNSTTYLCQECQSPKPYWENSTQSCVVVCPLATPYILPDNWCDACPVQSPIYDPEDNFCYAACPEGKFNNGSNYCLPCQGSTPYWDSTAYRCVATCPLSAPTNDSLGWCKPCDFPQPIWNQNTSKCEPCPSITPFWYTGNLSCLANCPPQVPVKGQNNLCQACSTLNYNLPYWNPNISTCVQYCPFLTSPDLTTKWCLPCDSSTKWVPSTSSCVVSCPPTAPILASNNSCLTCSSTSPYWDPVSSNCVSSCPHARPSTNNNWCSSCGSQKWNPDISICVPSCLLPKPVTGSDNWCEPCPSATPYWDSITSTCVVNCPSSAPYLNTNNKSCTACTSGTFWDPIASNCVSTCPSDYPIVGANKWCQACPSQTPRWDSDIKQCVATCPILKPLTGSSNWCQACPSQTPRWDSINSACVTICPPAIPISDSNRWCQACSDNKKWDPSISQCVTECPINAPWTDGNKWCQPCPSIAPNWDPIASACVAKCPPAIPSIDENNWCKLCSNASFPYWDSIALACVDKCPGLLPYLDYNKNCVMCSGLTPKWNPLASTCVETCPDEIPFWNPYANLSACEAGPSVEGIIRYQESAGVAMTYTLAGVQMVFPGMPYVAVTVLLISLLRYLRYLDINYPPNVLKTFQQQSPNIPSLNFGPLFPESLKIDTLSHPAPSKYAQYDINGLFVANFWRGITTSAILVLALVLMKPLLKKTFGNKKITLIRDKAKNFLIWNYLCSFVISNTPAVSLYIILEYQNLYLHDFLGAISLIFNIGFSQGFLVAIALMMIGIYRLRTAKKYLNRESKLEANQSFKVLIEKVKDKHILQEFFIPILCIRAIINSVILTSFNPPSLQCSLFIVINLIMIFFYVKYRPFIEIVDNIQLIAFEVVLLIVDAACLHLSRLEPAKQIEAESAGRVIIFCNIAMFVLSFLFILSKGIISLLKIFKEKFMPRVPKPSTKEVSVQITLSAKTGGNTQNESFKFDTNQDSPSIVSPSVESFDRLEIQHEGENKINLKVISMNMNDVDEISPLPDGTTTRKNQKIKFFSD